MREIEKLETVATTFISSVPGPVTLNNTRRALDGRISLDSVERYSRYLEEPYLLFSLSTHSFSAGKRKRSPRKVYAVDNGILLTVSHRFSSDRGKLLENTVFLDLRRAGYEMYRFMNKKEVDFLIWKGTEPVALINVCLDVSDADNVSKSGDMKKIYSALNSRGVFASLSDGLIHNDIKP